MQNLQEKKTILMLNILRLLSIIARYINCKVKSIYKKLMKKTDDNNNNNNNNNIIIIILKSCKVN